MVALSRRSLARVEIPARDRLVGTHAGFQHCLELALQAAMTDLPILIIGETGTGKELIARAIHENSPRGDRPFVALNCGAIPAELVNSELFGHVRGAFTGATNDRSGVFVDADRGTLFLDELGELPAVLQPHLLRTLEQQTVRPVGSDRERAVDVRVIGATNQLEIGEEDGPLRLDLFHRLATFVVEVPPLRERPGDIPLLVRAFLEEIEPKIGRRRISLSVLRALEEYPWPGNVRELRQAVARAATLCADQLELDALLPRRQVKKAAVAGAPVPLSDLMRRALGTAYTDHGSIRRAAAALKVPKSTFADRAKRLGISTQKVRKR